jgi:hypothetical protein
MVRTLRTTWLYATLHLAAAAGCIGEIGDGAAGDEPAGGGPLVDAANVPRAGMRRLSQAEYDHTLADLLGETLATGEQLLPADDRTPFDNDYRTQFPSKALIEGAELASMDVAARLFADPARRDAVVGCEPAGPGDEACLRDFVGRFGRRALRRALGGDEVERYVGAALPLAVAEGDFYVAAEVVVRALLQHPELLYRIEIGTPIDGAPGLYRLNDWEVASRLSYLLWGTMPDDALLDRAEGGGLRTPSQIREVAAAMLEDPKAAPQLERFHAMWIGYENIPDDELGLAMQAETAALLRRVVFDEKRPWQDVLRMQETFVSELLASHYGLPSPGSAGPGWVSYGESGRRGLLSHGTFLSLGGKFGDTSPTTRGLMVRTRLLCQVIPPPPPGVNTDDPPTSDVGPCKQDAYQAHSQGGCANCHSQLDPVGFGLENYDSLGRYRTHEADNPQCAIEGKGELVPFGEFHGPAALGDRLLEAGISQCLMSQMYRYAAGRAELDSIDQELVLRAAEALGEGDYRLDALIVELVSTEAFGYRREEVKP